MLAIKKQLLTAFGMNLCIGLLCLLYTGGPINAEEPIFDPAKLDRYEVEGNDPFFNIKAFVRICSKTENQGKENNKDAPEEWVESCRTLAEIPAECWFGKDDSCHVPNPNSSELHQDIESCQNQVKSGNCIPPS